ncbi:uncharacterized protein PV07_08825 [Cladophialophora immunda]|uniref:F-box domain-containing protein n=1 Tax=Cladophialophora immunda TaxID=569365 RepID=A0A0D2CPZ1_9EURO|nr:uncharacterized protein PV07_08825 [Cladophialophora immunda]KIW25664.1 hypothetical protein PV07_08825 [Cladophialophora immunda]
MTIPSRTAVSIIGGLMAPNGRRRREGVDPNISEKYPEILLGECGFRDIQSVTYKLPQNHWPADARSRKMGYWNEVDTLNDLEGLSPRLFAGALGWSREEVQLSTAGLADDVRDTSIHARSWFLPSRKRMRRGTKSPPGGIPCLIHGQTGERLLRMVQGPWITGNPQQSQYVTHYHAANIMGSVHSTSPSPQSRARPVTDFGDNPPSFPKQESVYELCKPARATTHFSPFRTILPYSIIRINSQTLCFDNIPRVSDYINTRLEASHHHSTAQGSGPAQIQIDRLIPLRPQSVMIELFARLSHILRSRHSPSSASSSRPPLKDTSTAVEPEVVALPGLARLPPELLLQIIQYLPAESAAVFALISKYHYAALKQHVLPGLSSMAVKKRFLRLLEVDLAEYIACHCCDILYRWKALAPPYYCPRRSRLEMSGIHTPRPWCTYYPEHQPHYLTLETVAAFLRGYEHGSAYGPQLQELHHKCDIPLPRHFWAPDVSRDTVARVVNGKLLVRTSYSLQMSLQQSLAAQLDRLNFIGCLHSPGTLPALVKDAIDHHLGRPYKAPRCFDYINCAECATDLRVAVLDTKGDRLVAQITTWQCYGGRDIDQEAYTVRRMLGYLFACEGEGEGGTQSLEYRRAPPSRNLELLYNESLGDGGSLANGLQQRHRWLHWWDWSYPGYTNAPHICCYIGPD